MQGQPRILRQAVWMGLASVALLVGKSSGGIRAAPPPDPKTLEIQPEDLQRARAWVEQLGSPVYTEREQAQTELARMGRLARLALQEALASHPDPEVRQRCAVLLPAAIEDDIKVRLTVFLADTAGRYTHQLPGWEAFRAIACNEWRWCGWVLARDASLEPAARKLYAEMLQTPANRDLLFASENPHASISQLLTE
ncbi:MAG: hypothetical protein NZ703_02125, partial [Gemmataceae bacterium]|nr:hypothetical protein [Gemmataceae bacterium]